MWFHQNALRSEIGKKSNLTSFEELIEDQDFSKHVLKFQFFSSASCDQLQIFDTSKTFWINVLLKTKQLLFHIVIAVPLAALC